MLVKDRLAWHREEGLRVRGHPVVFPSTEPKSASFVQVSHIAHAVPDEFPIADLGQCGLGFPLVILPGYHRSFNYDFTDLFRRKCQRLVPCWKDLIADPDNLQRNPRKGTSHADTGTLIAEMKRFGQDL